MKVFSKMRTGCNKYLNNIKQNYGTYLAKAAGIGALGLVAYDAHVLGLLQSDSYSKSRDAEACIDKATNAQEISFPSAINSKLKEKVFRTEQDQNWRSFINSGIGYIKGFGESLISNVIPLGLGLFTVLASKKSWVKTGGWILGGYGVICFLKDVMGVGRSKDLNKRF